MAASDLTVIRDSRTGSHKGDERGCRRDEKVTRNDDKKLQPCLKVTVGNLDGGQWQIASVPSLNSSPPLKNPPKCPFRSQFRRDSISQKRRESSPLHVRTNVMAGSVTRLSLSLCSFCCAINGFVYSPRPRRHSMTALTWTSVSQLCNDIRVLLRILLFSLFVGACKYHFHFQF